MPILFRLIRGIRRHYDHHVEELTPPPAEVTLPSRIHGVVLVSRLHAPALRALAFARATPDTLTGITVRTSPQATPLREWAQRDVPVPLAVVNSRYRDVTGSILEDIRFVRRESPRKSSASSSRSTSSGTGGNSCCTTEPRCDSKPGCSSCPA